MGEVRPNNAYLGLNLDSVTAQVKPGQLTYAQNAMLSGVEGNMVTYQNEQANELCFSPPAGYIIIGAHPIIEKNMTIYWLANPTTGQSEIGKVVNCVYSTVINADCLNFSIRNPIQKAVHKITSCTTEVYWAEISNPRRFIDLDNLPFRQVVQGTNTDPCAVVTTSEIDCNKMNVQPNLFIPEIAYSQVGSDGTITAGVYQFTVQYSNQVGDAYTSYYSVTDPIPIYDFFKVTPDFNYQVGRSIQIDITNLDTTGLFDYINVAVIKTINNITSVDLVGTFRIEKGELKILYTGQSKANIALSINDIFEKFPVYDSAGDITALDDILVWDDLTTTERLSYQSIASQLHLQWVSWILPPDKKQYRNEINAAERRGYMRDEVYAFDLVFILRNGYQTDRFPIPGRVATPADLEMINNADSQFGEDICSEPQSRPRWQVYNTATVTGFDPQFLANQGDPCYQGPYQFGEFSYWESTETYPCNEAVFGTLQGQPIRHHKFPDSSVTHHHDNNGNIYPLGVRIDMLQLYNLINNSDLTSSQKANIAAVKIVRANRSNAKSIIAKGLLFNVGKYSKDNTSYFYPNYPFNDLRPDPFITNTQQGSIGTELFASFEQNQTVGSADTELYTTTLLPDTWKNNGDIVTAKYQGKFAGAQSQKILHVTFDGVTIYNSGLLVVNDSNSFILTVKITRTNASRIDVSSKLEVFGASPRTTNSVSNITTVDFSIAHTIKLIGQSIDFNIPSTVLDGDISTDSAEVGYTAAPTLGVILNLLDGFASTDSEQRFTFHSPDTSFYQPFLGNVLKLESVEYGKTRSHFTEVKKHSRYAFPSLNSYLTSLGVGVIIGFASGTYGLSNNVFSGSAAFTAFTVMNDVIFKLIPKVNMAFQFNSLGNYTKDVTLPNDTGNKIRQIDIGTYLIPGMQGVGDIDVVNNYQRESSIYIRTVGTLPFPDTVVGVPQDNSRFTLGEVGCQNGIYNRDISAYYGSIKSFAPDQYGQIFSYDAIDTGFQFAIDTTIPFTGIRLQDVFGGDTFINKFAFKRKLPFFLDNRVNFPDESDIFYDELGNIGFPRYWFSTDIKRGDGGAFGIGALFGVKVNNFDCQGHKFFYDSGKIYLFAYGIVDYYAESGVNVDLRQAYNALEGDYYPHVSGDIPDDWLQEINVTIAFDNTYTYNKSYSKQNLENTFTTLPVDFIPNQLCKQHLPNRAIYSEPQEDVINYTKNNWLIYRPVSYFDFPLNFGKLTSLDGIETRQLLARFENKTLLYNALLTSQSSQGNVYLGQQLFSKSAPPVDFAETDLGYAGSQHKFLLRTEHGHIYVDAKRGNVFLAKGNSMENISNEGLSMFFMNNLNFQIVQSFPDYDIDNSFKGVGITGVYDNKYERFLLTKLDYRPLNSSIVYDQINDIFTLNGTRVELSDTRYFCNASFTLSYYFREKVWVAFHSYLPRFYVGDIDKFYTGIPGSVWRHNTVLGRYNNFYGIIQPYVLEYPFSYKFADEILQSVQDFTKVNRIVDLQQFVQTDDVYFNKAILYNDQQCSGVRNLIAKPQNDLSAYLKYPKFNSDSIDTLFVKSDNFYNYNGFWDVVADYSKPIWLSPCVSLSRDKELNVVNMDYSPRSFKKYPIRAKDSKVRHILDNRDDVRMTSQFITQDTQTSYK